MKLSVSSRGWNNRGFEWFEKIAFEMGFSGLELYNCHLKNSCITVSDNPSSALRTIREHNLHAVCLDTSCSLTSENNCTYEIVRNIELASALCASFVSFCALEDNEDLFRQRLEELIPVAEKNNVTLLVETKGIYADTARLAAMLDSFAMDSLGALWDIHHTFRDFREMPEDTVSNLGAWVKHVHVKDSDDSGKYVFIGEGTHPLSDVVSALSSVDYDGFVSLEWKPDWSDELKDPYVIFPYFVSYMEKFTVQENKKRLYPNFDGSGYYIFKENHLLDMTFSQVLDTLVREIPDQWAFRYTTLDYSRTFREFENDVNDFARGLISLGVKPGHKVSIWATNVPQWFIAFWAVTKIGAILVSVNTAYKIHEVQYLLRQSDTHTLIMVRGNKDTDYGQIINEICPEIKTSKAGSPLHCKALPFLRNVITAGFEMDGCLTFEQTCDRKKDVSLNEVLAYAHRVKSSDVCNMQYTSGTTGFPKGVMLTHYSVLNNGKCIGDRMGLSTADRMMLQVPMFHCFGMVLSMTAAMTHGTTLCPLPYFSAKTSLDCINQEKITCFNGVPTMFIAMFNHPNYSKTDFSYMRTGIMAGAGCPPDLMRKAALPSEMNMRGIVSVYGQTESSPGSTMSAWTDSIDVRCDTVGYAFPHVLCKIIDPETGKELPDGVNGEFCSKGYNTMKGYYKMAGATRRAIDNDRWLHSGDLAVRDSNGCYRITGRLKDMIIRGGENIYPKEIEEFIYTHPSVRDVQVIGVYDEVYGEEAAACIILKEGANVTQEQMRTYMTENIARHKVPKYILFVEDFPMNAAGKVLKYKMREELENKLNIKKKN